MSAYNVGSSGPNLTRLYRATWLEAAVIKLTLIVLGVSPTKFGRAKNVRNSERFLTTFDFDREYLRNGLAYRKSEKYLISCISSPIRRRKFGELRSTNQTVMDAHVDPPNWTFSWYYISALRGAGPSNFDTRYRSTKAC